MATVVIGHIEKLIWRELEEDRLECYKNISESLTESTLDSALAKDLNKKIDDVLKVLLKDVGSDRADVAQPALQILGYILILAAAEDSSFLAATSQADVLDKLLSVITTTADKQTCTRSLWCLSKQNFLKEILKDKIDQILEVLILSQCSKKFQSMTVEHESINLLIRFMEQIPDELKACADKWGKLLYPHLVHSAPKVRERAFLAMEMALPMLLSHKDVIAKQLAADLKTLLLSDLKKLMSSGQELYALEVWMIYVQLLGKLLHHGSLINALLPITEQGFKNSKPSVKCAAYKAWKVLIDNFALNPEIVSDQKRVKLLMQVFKINNTKTEAIAVEKMTVWWHFIVQLSSKASFYFEQVIVPLLQYIVGGGYLQATVSKPGTPVAITPVHRKGQPSPATPNINLKGATPGGNMGGFESVMVKGFEVLARLVGCASEDVEGFKFSIDEVKPDIITGISFYQKHAAVFISTFKLLAESGVPIHEGLLYQTWCSLVAHTKNSLEIGSKKDSLEVFTSLVTCYREIMVSQQLPSNLMLKMMDALLCLPTKILGSAAYSICGSRDQMMQGCPALVLVEMLFHDRILETQAATGQEKFFVLLEKLVQVVLSTPSNVLQSGDTMLQLVEKAVTTVENRESLWRMWSVIVNPLLQQVTQTNEVNQGDALEYNFSCLTLALTLPIVHIISGDLPQGTLKTMMKTWIEIYSTFSRLAAMVSNAEANIACEVVCDRIVSAKVDIKNSPLHVEALAQAILAMTEKVDFSSLSNNFGFLGALSHSPSQFGKKKQCRSLGNINALVILLGQLIDGVHITNKIDPQDLKKMTTMSSLQTVALNLIQVTSSLFNHLPSSQMISSTTSSLAEPMSTLFVDSAVSGNKIYSSQVLQKLDKMWVDVVTCLQSRFGGPYDSEFLEEVSPLLEATFPHPRRSIKNQTLILWNATFAKSNSLDYSDSLKSVLKEVRNKTMLILPGWESSAIMEDTQVSQITQNDSQSQQVPVPPNIIGFQSPVKSVGSFLNKGVSPNIKNSPLKKSPASKKAVRSLSDMNDKDFVVINNLPKKKRVLTEHQKEVMKEKRTLPAMYNNLDISQDRSLMSQFLNADSQMSQMSTPTPTTDMSIAPFPFILPDKPAEKPKSVEDANKASAASDVPELSNEKPAEKKGPKTRRRSVRFLDGQPSEDETSSQEKSLQDQMDKTEKDQNYEVEKAKDVPKDDVKDKPVTDSEVVFIESETQDDCDKAIVIESQSQFESKIEAGTSGKVELEGSETQSCSEMVTVVKEENNSAKTSESDTAKAAKRPTEVEKEAEGTPRRSKRHSIASDLDTTARRNIAEKDLKEAKPSHTDSEPSESEDKSCAKTESPTKAGRKKGQSLTDSQSSESEDKSSAKSESPTKSASRKRGRPRKVLSPEKTNSITKYLSKAAMKPEPVTLVEESQFMVEEMQAKMEQLDGSVSIIETPMKEDDMDADIGDVVNASQNLADKLAPLVKVEDNTKIVVEPAMKGDALKPFVQLERLSPTDIEKHKRVLRNRPGSDSDSSEKSGKENKARSSQLKKRNSLLKFSRAGKAIQELEDGDSSKQSIPPVNLDDIVPCSQDPFDFQKKMKDSESENDESKAEPSVGDDKSQNSVESKCEDMEVDNEIKSIPETEVDGESPTESVSQVAQEIDSDNNAKSNPDIVPLDSSEIVESQNSQTTIVSLKNQPVKSDSSGDIDSSQSSTDSQSSRPKRIRTPKKNFCSCHGDIEAHQKSLSCKDSDCDQSDSSQKVKKRRGRPRKLEGTIEESAQEKLFLQTIDDRLTSSSEECVANNPNTDVEEEIVAKTDRQEEIVAEEPEKELNEKCNMDTESDDGNNSDVPLSVVKNNLDISTDDIPLSELNVSDDHIPLCKLVDLEKQTEGISSADKTTNGDQSQEKRRPLSRKRKRGAKRRRSNEKNESDKKVESLEVEEPAAPKEDEVRDGEQSSKLAECEEEEKEVAPEKESDPVERPQTAEVEPKTSPKKLAPVGKGSSPPKKGRPFDIPETPTSAKKFGVSRASFILEQARKISISKAFPSPSLHHRKRFTGIKSSPRMNRPFPGGILKARVSTDYTSSPPQNRLVPSSPSFRPVNLPRVYSPSASPSAGILKRRRLTEDLPVDSPSPPCKQRRVCFNEELDVCVTSPNASPSKPVNRCLELAKGQQPAQNTTRSKLGKKIKDTDGKSDSFAVPRVISRPKDSQQMSMSQASVSCTQESQLNGTDPICPDLVDCEVPVEQVLPQLTSSTWVRGLSKFVRSRNIKTVGDLSGLTECEIHNLPLRSPRVQTVREVLSAYTNKGKPKETPAAPEVAEQSSPSKLPNVDDELERMSPIKGDLDTSMDSEDDNHLQLDATNSEETMADQVASAATTDEDAKTASVFPEVPDETEPQPTPSSSRVSALKLVEDFTESLNEDLLSSTSRSDMLGIYNKLNRTLSSIFVSMMNRCPESPTDSSSTKTDDS